MKSLYLKGGVMNNHILITKDDIPHKMEELQLIYS
jgi:hypothetical protein